MSNFARRDTPAALGLPAWLEAEGFGLAGVLSVGDYDAQVPRAWQHGRCAPAAATATTAVLLGTPGSLHFERFRASTASTLDDFTRGQIHRLTAELDGWGYLYCDTAEGAFADFVALGQAAGLGVPSDLGLLLHPEYGPWFAIRAVVLLEQELEPSLPLSGYQPCSRCPAPCRRVCPASAPGPDGFDVGACGSHRGKNNCESVCDARRACPEGAAHRYGPEAEAWHQRASAKFLTDLSSG